MPYLVTEPEIEAKLIEVMSHPEFPATCMEYERLLAKLGNVDGNEIIALVILAMGNVEANYLSNEHH